MPNTNTTMLPKTVDKPKFTYIFCILDPKVFCLWWQNMHPLNIWRRIYNV